MPSQPCVLLTAPPLHLGIDQAEQSAGVARDHQLLVGRDHPGRHRLLERRSWWRGAVALEIDFEAEPR
jgi:hypothetical protein